MRQPAVLALIALSALGWVSCSQDPFETARAAYHDGDYAQAIELWTALAEQGHADSQSFLGLMYSEGKGVPQNYPEAIRLFRLAADQGQPKALFNLGGCYAMGLGLEQDCFEAYVLLYQAEAAGIREASSGIDFCEQFLTPEQIEEASIRAEAASPPSDL